MSTKSPTERARANRNKARARTPHDERQAAAGRSTGQPAGPIPIVVAPQTRAEEIAALLPPGFQADGFELFENPDKATTLRVYGKVRPTVTTGPDKFIGGVNGAHSEPLQITPAAPRDSQLGKAMAANFTSLIDLQHAIQDLEEAVDFVALPSGITEVGANGDQSKPVQSKAMEQLEQQRAFIHHLAARIRHLTNRVEA